MSDKSDKGKQPAREKSQDKWAMDLAKSGGLEIKGSSMEQPVEAGSSSNASLVPMGQPLPGVGPSNNVSMVAESSRVPATHVTVIIRFAHGDVHLPLFVVGRYPMFAEMFEGGILHWPGASRRQAQIITHYLRDPKPKYKMVYFEAMSHEDRLEREFTDALAINVQATSFNLFGLAGLALAHMQEYGEMIPLTRIIVNFMAQGEWYQRNRAYVQHYITRRSTSTCRMAMDSDRRWSGLQTGDALIDGLLGAINNLRFPDLRFAPGPRHYY
ncbi:hypothetical protein FPANT_8239 [Fusarium pseudoanthophilum]|uniref:Uncharacterized protein n=1 Tax=Fusarium pseudoanthophilum TaxID=48495 RepID=A0A8H5NYE5_9HYPO|nr:hypothetical protein FPANT_8239 [Fusarium pseudoanthophilum]